MKAWTLILLLPVSACAPATQGSLEALCDGARASRADHAAALAASADDAAVLTGDRLIRQIDAACASQQIQFAGL